MGAAAVGSMGESVAAAARQASMEDEQEVFKRQQKMFKKEFVNFVTSSKMLEECDMTSVCFEPIFRMCHQSLEMGAAKWEDEQRATVYNMFCTTYPRIAWPNTLVENMFFDFVSLYMFVIGVQPAYSKHHVLKAFRVKQRSICIVVRSEWFRLV